MRALILGVAAGLALTAFWAPADAYAQGRIGDRVGTRVEDARARGVDSRNPRERRDDRYDPRRDRRDDRYDPRRDRRDDRYDQRRDSRVQQRNAGPPFCRNGVGHPVHGMRWCYEKGYSSRPIRWERATWGDITMRNPRRAERGSAGRVLLGDILGESIYGRVDAQRRALGVTEPLLGRWHRDPAGMYVLQLTAGGVPIAEFVDRGGNGRVDIVRVNRGR
jgi:hypothetical protein